MRRVFRLRLKEDPKVPLEVRQLTPDTLTSLKIEDTYVWLGNRKIRTVDIFDVESWIEDSETNEIVIIFEGKGTERMRYVAYRMSMGKIIVRGGVGPLAGYRMRGGELIIEGDADHYLGAKMKNGKIEVHGNAGSCVGGKLIGENYGNGMKGGTIIIHGNAGSFIGHGMKGGDIIIKGSAKDYVGYGMKGGNILVHGDVGLYPGARMSGGRIIILGNVEDVLASFYIDSIVNGIKFKGQKIDGKFVIFLGDVLTESRGRLIINYDKNLHIVKKLEQLLEPVTEDPYK